MALTTAFFTALSGLGVNSENLNVIGNNIANVNTPGFKASTSVFMSQFSATKSYGTPPGANTGGTNPQQIGVGTQFASIQRNWGNGAVQTTGINTNMALEGSGLFIVDVAGQMTFTRAGNFTLNRDNVLVDPTGAIVQGYGIDENFNIQPGTLEDVVMPLGTLQIAEATRNVTFKGNLNSDGPLSTGGSLHTSRRFYTTAASAATDAGVGDPNLEDGTLDLTVAGNDLYINNGSGGSQLAFEGGTSTVITIEGCEKGGKAMGAHTFAFVATQAEADTLGVDYYGQTLDDFAQFMDNVLGVDSTNVLGDDLGGSVTITDGQLTVQGNEGTVQGLDVQTTHMAATNDNPGGGAAGNPFIMTRINTADGESVRTSFVVYDSLGTPLTVDLSFVKQQTVANEGTVWEFIAESGDTDATNGDRVLALGVVEFDANGNFVSSSNSSFSLIRANGSVSPLTVNMEFDTGSDAITSLRDTASTLNAVSQDGSPIGTLSDFSVGNDGTITGAFTNGLTRTLGQIAVATFGNPEGLIDLGNNHYRTGPNSGNPLIGAPLQNGAGNVLAGSVELSNVDLATEFVNLISASTGFSSSSRVITTTDQLIQQLLTLGR